MIVRYRVSKRPNVPDARVTDAVSHWLPRFIQNGVDFNDSSRTTLDVRFRTSAK
jgi:hypothetical protein